MCEYVMGQFGGRTSGLLQQLGLTPGHMRVLFLLEPDIARPMGSVAQGLACDASTVTWLIDRLEERGLVERRPSPTDRRVKAVALTPVGMTTKATLQERLYEPPPELLALDRAALEALRKLLLEIGNEPALATKAAGGEAT
jgi:DNA-binding MarR family transcriptional regulator